MCEYKQGYRWVETYLWFGWQWQQHSCIPNLCNLKGNLTQRHKEIFYKNPLFVGMRLPEVREVGSVEKKFPRISPVALDLMKVFINKPKYCSLQVIVACKCVCSFSKNKCHKNHYFLCTQKCWIYICLCLGLCVAYFATLSAHHEQRDLSEFLAISAKLPLMAILALKFLQKKLPPLGLDLMITWSIVWCCPT